MDERQVRNGRRGQALCALIILSGLNRVSQAGVAENALPSLGGGTLIMLRQTAVQRELMLTPSQISRLDEAQQTIRQSLQRNMLQRNEANTDTDVPRPSLTSYRHLQEGAITTILDAAQQRRLRQLDLQRLGIVAAIVRPDITVALQLTPAQNAKVAQIRAQAISAQFAVSDGIELRRMSPEQTARYKARIQALQQAESDRLTALLTAEQKACWRALLGPPFIFPPQSAEPRSGHPAQ